MFDAIHPEDLVHWQDIDAAIIGLAGKKGEIDDEIGRWLLAAHRLRIDRQLGFGSFEEYCERRLGYTPHVTRDRLRVAEALEELPRIRALLRSGERSWSAVREMVRVVRPEHEADWIAATEHQTVRQIERSVSGRRPGDRPSDAKDPLLEPRRLVFQVSPEVYAILTIAMDQLRTELPPKSSKEDVLRALAERALGSGRDGQHQPPYQVSLTLCAGCDRTWRTAGGEAVEVPPATGACARCDGVLAGVVTLDEGIVDPPAPAESHVGPSTMNPEPALEDQEPRPDLDGAPEPATKRELLDAVHRIVERGGWKALVRTASSVFGDAALKSVTPRLRAQVLARDQGRCSVPGCRHRLFLDVHHLKHRSRGGQNSLENILLLCSAHHALLHDGRLAIEGAPSTGLLFRHAWGSQYGAPISQVPAQSPTPV